MTLSIVNNVANTQIHQNRANGSLSKSLERLSSDLKTNRGAEEPVAPVVSAEQQTKIKALHTALDNTNKAVRLIQTGTDALNNISDLLGELRGLALNSAHSGGTDSQDRTQEQAEVAHLLQTINQIATTSHFNDQTLLDSSAGKVGDADHAPKFQIVEVGQTVSLAIDKVTTEALGVGASADGSNLSAIDVSTSTGAESAIAVIEQAMKQVSTLRSRLGAFQANVLPSNAKKLQEALENTPVGGATIRDIDSAQELADYTKNQVLLQAETTALSNANQTSQFFLSLLR